MERDWDAEAVIAASNEWVWVPDGAPTVRTSEYLVVAYPEWFVHPASARVFGSTRAAGELVDEIGRAAVGLGRHRLWWRVSDQTLTDPATPRFRALRRGAGAGDRPRDAVKASW